MNEDTNRVEQIEQQAKESELSRKPPNDQPVERKWRMHT